jgi:release factor glutamine methyltransferase
MFTDNSIRGLQSYFKNKLADFFTVREIEIFFEWICESKFSLSKSDILLNTHMFSEGEMLVFTKIADRLKTNEPIQYILEEAHFLDFKFKVNPSVLIPRPETEELVMFLIENNIQGKILDIGTGSGIIPISLKKKLPALEADGLDVSEEAIRLAQENADYLGVEVEFIQSDILNENITDIYDAIISNPPYVLEIDRNEMSENVLNFEPDLALFVPDQDPLRFYKRIVQLSESALKPSGRIAFEIHEKYGDEVADLLKLAYDDIQVIKDLQGKNRIVSAIKKP